jgi:hypothetical protein
VLRDPKYGVKGMQPDSIAVLDQAKRFLDAQVQKAAMVPAEQRIWGDAKKVLTTQLDAINPDYAQARAIVAQNRQTVVDPIFGLHVPQTCANVPAEILTPRNTWADKAAYDAKATELAMKFRENESKFKMSDAVKAAGPKVSAAKPVTVG